MGIGGSLPAPSPATLRVATSPAARERWFDDVPPLPGSTRSRQWG